MGVSDIIDLIDRDNEVYTAVDLISIAKELGSDKHRDPLRLIIDTADCLHRLYGGYYNDWICGGQWCSAYKFIENFCRTCNKTGIDLIAIIHGCGYPKHQVEWYHIESSRRMKSSRLVKQLKFKGVIPDKNKWVAPMPLTMCLRLAFRCQTELHRCRLFTTIDDHCVEVLQYFKRKNAYGLLAHKSDYLLLGAPMLFDSVALLLARKFTHLNSRQVSMESFYSRLGLPAGRIPLLATLLGNHLLTGDFLSDFHHGMLGDESTYKFASPLERFTKLLKGVIQFITALPEDLHLEDIAKTAFGKNYSTEMFSKFQSSYHYFERHQFSKRVKHESNEEINSTVVLAPIGSQLQCSDRDSSIQRESDTPSTSNNVDDALNTGYDDAKDTSSDSLLLNSTDQQLNGEPLCSAQIIKVIKERHKNGLMCPEIAHIMFQRQIWLCSGIEDECNNELPANSFVFREARSYIYGMLLDISHSTSAVPAINEWSGDKGSNLDKPCRVEARALPGLVCPPLNELWLARNPSIEQIRKKAFLTTMRSDHNSINMLPMDKIFISSILRYMVQFNHNGVCFLQKRELEVFLVQTVSLHLHDSRTLSDIDIQTVSIRGMELASLFMSGVHTAILANDATACPIPWKLCLPWTYFDGKLFHSKLILAYSGKPLIELCDFRFDLVSQVEYLSKCILDGLTIEFSKPKSDLQPHINPYQTPPFFGTPYNQGSYGKQQRVKQPVSSRAGRLDIAGVTVGYWEGNSRGRSMHLPPQVTHIGPGKRGRSGHQRGRSSVGRGHNRTGRLWNQFNQLQTDEIINEMISNEFTNRRNRFSHRLPQKDPLANSNSTNTQFPGAGRGLTVGCNVITDAKSTEDDSSSSLSSDLENSDLRNHVGNN